ncbi:MAG TPA: SpoIIE family protein phosphatase [Gemmataceae bacterium]|nr:SpoIIE family protein phosphatase [Gemmataceae bacterium]
MPPAAQLRILLAGDPVPAGLRAGLEAAGFGVAAAGLSGINPADVSKSQAVLLVVTPRVLATAQALCRRWRIELGEQYVPIIWLASADVPAAAGLDAGADTVLPDTAGADHVLAQAKALLRVQHLYGRLAGRAAEAQNLNQRLQHAYQQIDGDSELTRRIHRGFLPRSLPEVGSARFAVCYRPRSRIGGDFYDVVRLDEEHVGVYVADAMGRGLPASSLLSIFVKKALPLKDILGRSYRLVPPGEVLDRVNRELLNLSLPEPPFVTMVYVQLNCRDGALAFARAAHPHPLYLPADGSPSYWYGPGTLLGVFESEFPVQQKRLRPGDKLVLFSDGVHPPTTGPRSLHDPLVESAKRHRSLPVQAFADSVAHDLLEESRHPEDFTVVAIEYQ